MNEVSEERFLTDGEINRFLPRPFLAENKKRCNRLLPTIHYIGFNVSRRVQNADDFTTFFCRSSVKGCVLSSFFYSSVY